MERVIGKANVIAGKPLTGAEDFSFYQKVIPGFFWLLGAGNPDLGITAPHHTPEFNIDDGVFVPASRWPRTSCSITWSVTSRSGTKAFAVESILTECIPGGWR